MENVVNRITNEIKQEPQVIDQRLANRLLEVLARTKSTKSYTDLKEALSLYEQYLNKKKGMAQA